MISTRRSISPAADILVEPIIEHVRKTREPFERVLHSKRLNRAWRFYAWPIIGPFGDVHGIHMWVGDPKEKMTPRRLTSGGVLVDHRLADLPDLGVRGHVGNVARRLGAYGAFFGLHQSGNPYGERTGVPRDHPGTQAGMVLSTWFSVRHDHGHAMQWQVILRPTADGKGVRVLYHDFSDAIRHPYPRSPNSDSPKDSTGQRCTSHSSKLTGGARSCCGSAVPRSGSNGSTRT